MESIPSLDELRKLSPDSLQRVSDDLKSFVLNATKEKAGHLASSLGVAELTLTLHYLLNTPDDILLWDVGHQAYIHKVITDRANVFKFNRKKNGPSGFPNIKESEFDSFGVGHSSTTLSALIGFARADKINNRNRKKVAVVGDGAFTAGMIYEALNDAGSKDDDILLIINDNGLAIEENSGALHDFSRYKEFCESLGWNFIGRNIEGNNTIELVKKIKYALSLSGPRVLLILTKRPSLKDLGLKENPPSKKSFQIHFAKKLIELAKTENRLVALTAAMAPGCSLDLFRKNFPDRFFDVGIAEQHVLTQAAGLAAAGMRPVVNLYSTFSQRAVDQWIHDIALQNLPVIMCLDRSGIVGEDGATHHGVFDLALYRVVPNTEIWAPRNNLELKNSIEEAFLKAIPAIIRYPKGDEPELKEPLKREGEMDIFRYGGNTIHWCLGTSISDALTYSKKTDGVIDLRKAKPIDYNTLKKFSKNSSHWVVWEDAQLIGGVGEALSSFITENNLDIKLTQMGYPDNFIGHGKTDNLKIENRREINQT
jgi:1-deoxy-D-xylulose-5-phosphate synthase